MGEDLHVSRLSQSASWIGGEELVISMDKCVWFLLGYRLGGVVLWKLAIFDRWLDEIVVIYPSKANF
jgi:hypothetical protein